MHGKALHPVALDLDLDLQQGLLCCMSHGYCISLCFAACKRAPVVPLWRTCYLPRGACPSRHPSVHEESRRETTKQQFIAFWRDSVMEASLLVHQHMHADEETTAEIWPQLTQVRRFVVGTLYFTTGALWGLVNA